MSSWIPSIFNPPSSATDNDPTNPASGVKHDISAVFRGVADFLAPPPSSAPPAAADSIISSEAISGIKNDLAELQGSLKSGLSLISSKLASNFLPFNSGVNDDDDEEEDVVGINEEVVEFVRKLSGRPELWTDFPLSLPDDFRLSDYQIEHAASIDNLVPEFAILRQKSCSHISEEKFWLIYFILLCPRLNEEDLELLSSPEVDEARERLLKKLQKKDDVAQETSKNSESSDSNNNSDQDTSQQKDISVKIESSSKQRDFVTEMGSDNHSEGTATAPRRSVNSEFSFTDLEDGDSDIQGAESDKISRSGSHVWVQHNESSGAESSNRKTRRSGLRDKGSEGEDSSDWHNVDDTDLDSLA